jgi:hypothetical protein
LSFLPFFAMSTPSCDPQPSRSNAYRAVPGKR